MKRDRKALRAALEAQGACRVCGTQNNLDPHHITPRALVQDDSRENIVALCRTHHDMVEDKTLTLWPFLTPAERLHAQRLQKRYKLRSTPELRLIDGEAA